MAGLIFPKLIDQRNRIFFFFFAVPWGMWDHAPHQGLNLYPLHWECKVLTTGPPGTSPELCLCVPIPLFGLEQGLNLTELVGEATGSS